MRSEARVLESLLGKTEIFGGGTSMIFFFYDFLGLRNEKKICIPFSSAFLIFI